MLLKTLNYDQVVGEIETADADQSAALQAAPLVTLANKLRGGASKEDDPAPTPEDKGKLARTLTRVEEEERTKAFGKRVGTAHSL